MGFRGRKHDDELNATGLARILQETDRPGLEWTSSYDQGAVKIKQGVDLPFSHAKLHLRVKPDSGGAEFESDATVRDGDQEHLDARHLTYVRFDPAHPEQCEIDRERLEREFGQVGYGRHPEKRNTIPLGVSQELARQAFGGEQPPAGSAPEVTSPPLTAADSSDVADQLAKLARMHADGTLTDEEFAQAKARLLSSGA